MITLTEIDKSIQLLIDKGNDVVLKKTEKQKVKIRNKIKFLKLLRHYVEKEPSEEFIKQELDSIETKVSVLEERFSMSTISIESKSVLSELKIKYNNENDIPNMKNQMKALKILLKKKKII